MAERNIRIALGKDREHLTRMRDRLAFEATMRRIMREGA
jgi:hypothetical protein